MIDDRPLRVATLKALVGLSIPPQNGYDRGAKAYTSNAHLHRMRDEAIAGIDVLPIDKLSRWLGYIQGVLADRGKLDVAAERDRTRPIFHEAYEAMGIDRPETKEL